MLVKLDEFEKIINQQKGEIAASQRTRDDKDQTSSPTNDPEQSTKKQVAVENRPRRNRYY